MAIMKFEDLRKTMPAKSRLRSDKLLSQEELILDVTERIWKRMKTKHINKVQLAGKLECSQPHVTKLLNGGRNMTLRTLSDIAGALDGEVRISIVGKK